MNNNEDKIIFKESLVDHPIPEALLKRHFEEITITGELEQDNIDYLATQAGNAIESLLKQHEKAFAPIPRGSFPQYRYLSWTLELEESQETYQDFIFEDEYCYLVFRVKDGKEPSCYRHHKDPYATTRYREAMIGRDDPEAYWANMLKHEGIRFDVIEFFEDIAQAQETMDRLVHSLNGTHDPQQHLTLLESGGRVNKHPVLIVSHLALANLFDHQEHFIERILLDFPIDVLNVSGEGKVLRLRHDVAHSTYVQLGEDDLVITNTGPMDDPSSPERTGFLSKPIPTTIQPTPEFIEQTKEKLKALFIESIEAKDKQYTSITRLTHG